MTRAEYLAEFGTTGITAWTLRPDEFREELKGSRGRLLRQQMGASPQGAAIRRAIEMAYRRLDWHAQPGGDSEADARAAQFVDECVKDLNIPWPSVFSQIMSNSLEQGFVPMELVYKLRQGRAGNPPSKYDDGLIGWRKWAPRPAMTLQEWKIADDGGWDGFVQVPAPSGRLPRPIPKEKALLFRLDDRTGSPEGAGGVYDAGYRSYYFIHELETIEAIVEERGGGVLVITLSEQANPDPNDPDSDFSRAQKIVVNFRIDEQMGLVLPYGYTVELLTPGAAVENIDRSIRRHELAFFRAALAQWAMLGGTDVGSWALSSDQTDLFILLLNGWLGIYKSVINDVAIPRLIDLNFRLPAFAEMADMTDYPTLDHAPITKEQAEGWARAVTLLVGAGFLTPVAEDERWARERLGLPELTEEEVPAGEEVPEPGIAKEQAVAEMREASLMLARDQATAGDLVDAGVIGQADADAIIGPSLAMFQQASAKVKELVQVKVRKAERPIEVISEKHVSEEAEHTCPLCGHGKADRYEGHGGLLVCKNCLCTYDPQIE